MIRFDPDLKKKLAAGKPREVFDRAFRIRAGMQGALASCLCAYPLIDYPTSTGHDELCPGHLVLESQRRALEVGSC